MANGRGKTQELQQKKRKIIKRQERKMSKH